VWIWKQGEDELRMRTWSNRLWHFENETGFMEQWAWKVGWMSRPITDAQRKGKLWINEMKMETILVARTKYHRLYTGYFISNRNLLFTVWELQVLVRVLAWVADCRLLTISSHGEMKRPFRDLSYKDTNQIPDGHSYDSISSHTPKFLIPSPGGG
jgi:hypothetical protein